MKKVLLIGVVVVAGVVVAAPKFGSTRFEQQLNKIVERVNHYPGYSATIVSNQQGWFSADTKIKIALDLSATSQFAKQAALADFPPIEVTTDLHTKFGPLLFSSNAMLGWFSTEVSVAGDQLRDKLTWDKQLPLIKWVYTNSLTNTTHWQDDIAPLTFKDESGELDITFSGYHGEGTWAGKQLSYQGNAASLALSGELDAKITNIGMKATADADLDELLAGAGYNGDTTFTIDAIDSAIFKAEKLAIDVTNSVDKKTDTSSLGMKYQVASATYMDSTASDLALNLNIGNIDSAFIRDYQKFIEELYSSTAEPQQLELQMAQFMMSKLPQLLSKSPNIKMSLSGKIPQGSLHADLDGSVVDIKDALTPQQMTDQRFWLSHVKAKFNAVADEDVANLIAAQVLKQQLASSPQFVQMTPEQRQQLLDGQSAMVLQQLIQQGLVTQNEGKFSISASIEQGIANLNGLPIPL